MTVFTLLRTALGLAPDAWADWVPANHITRQAWQDAVEALIVQIREEFDRPAFGLSEMEISVHYHLSLEKFAALIVEKLGFKN